MKSKLLFLFIAACCMEAHSQPYDVTLETLLDEMVSCESNTLFPDYFSLQQSSHDRRSTVPGNANWFANDDGFGFVRTENNEGR
jgi:hypothetical protein